MSIHKLSRAAGSKISFIENHYSHVVESRTLDTATKRFTEDEDDFVWADDDHRYPINKGSGKSHTNKRIKKSVPSVDALLDAKENKVLKRLYQKRELKGLHQDHKIEALKENTLEKNK